jgi:hypothetical protein
MHSKQMLVGKMRSLLKVHDLRVRQLESAYLEKRRLRDEAREALEQREASIAALKSRRSDMFRLLQQPEMESRTICHQQVYNSRYWIEYDLEKDEYYLDMDKDALAEAETELTEARSQWLRARAKRGGFEKALLAQQQEVESLREQQQEIEMEEIQYQRMELQ